MTGESIWADAAAWRGNCYEAAFKYLLAHADRDDLVLCHGEPVGRGEENGGVRFGHAWVERADGAVIDCTVPGGSKGIAWVLFYSLGDLVPMNVRRYTREQASVEALRTEHYGPWPDVPKEPRRRRRPVNVTPARYRPKETR